MRLPGFTPESLVELGCRVRDLHGQGSARVAAVDDDYLRALAYAVTGQLGGKVGIAPRLYLKKLVADVLDRVEQFDDFDPRVHYALTVGSGEMTPEESVAAGATTVDDIDLDL